MSPARSRKTRAGVRPLSERLTALRALSERDTRRVIALLENPPAANDRLVRAARASFVLPLAVAADAIKRGK